MKFLIACFGILSVTAFVLSLASYTRSLKTESALRGTPTLSRGDYESLLRMSSDYEIHRSEQRRQAEVEQHFLADPQPHGYAIPSYPIADPH